MIKSICTDETILSIPLEFKYSDINYTQVIKDLIDTAEYHLTKSLGCAGLAANQIGYKVPVIVVRTGLEWIVMINPVVVKGFGGKDYMREGCLSRPNITPRIQRFKKIRVDYNCGKMDRTGVVFRAYSARVIQHEIDHLNGIYIK